MLCLKDKQGQGISQGLFGGKKCKQTSDQNQFTFENVMKNSFCNDLRKSVGRSKQIYSFIIFEAEIHVNEKKIMQ